MVEIKLTAKRINTFLQHLEVLANSLPTREQKKEVEHELDSVITFLADFKARLTDLPTREEEARLEESLKVLRHFVMIAEADPFISKTLGLKPKRQRSRSGATRSNLRTDPSVIVKKLKGLSPEEVRGVLNQRENRCTVADLKQIAESMGVRIRGKTSRSVIIDQIVKRVENAAGYDYLRKNA